MCWLSATLPSGQRVCVLEMGGYHDESEFNGLELWAYQHLFLNLGFDPTNPTEREAFHVHDNAGANWQRLIVGAESDVAGITVELEVSAGFDAPGRFSPRVCAASCGKGVTARWDKISHRL